MRWWVRTVSTLMLAPVLWRLGAAYIANQQGVAWGDLARQSIPLLLHVYVSYSLPAFVLCGIVLAAADALLHRLGLDLLTVITSPVIAVLAASAALRFAPEAGAGAEGAVSLAAIYGVVWGLTIREPRSRLSKPMRTATRQPG